MNTIDQDARHKARMERKKAHIDACIIPDSANASSGLLTSSPGASGAFHEGSP